MIWNLYRNLPAGTEGEQDARLDHGTMVPLYFVNQYWTDYQLVRIGLSGLPFGLHFELGMCIKDTIEALGRKTVLIASGDLSHRLKENVLMDIERKGQNMTPVLWNLWDKQILEHFSNSQNVFAQRQESAAIVLLRFWQAPWKA